MNRSMFSLNICAEPSHIATPPVPGWKLKITLTPFSFEQLKTQTGMMWPEVEEAGFESPSYELPLVHLPLFDQHDQQPPGLVPR